MPIDRSFQSTWTPKGKHHGHTIWASASSQLGIHGTRVAVDFDACTGCLKCFIVCPEDVFSQWEAPSQQIKADPENETTCLECLACELVCPVEAILISRSISDSDTLSSLLD